jgi:hypothetical protein
METRAMITGFGRVCVHMKQWFLHVTHPHKSEARHSEGEVSFQRGGRYELVVE